MSKWLCIDTQIQELGCVMVHSCWASGLLLSICIAVSSIPDQQLYEWLHLVGCCSSLIGDCPCNLPKNMAGIIVFSGKWLMNWINNMSRKCKTNNCPTVIYSSVSNSKPNMSSYCAAVPRILEGSSPEAGWPERLTRRHRSWPVPAGRN